MAGELAGTSPPGWPRGPIRRSVAVSDPILQIEHLSKTYPDGTQALTDVSFTVAPGEFLVVIGLSGSGKSTLLRCLNRLVEPTSGTSHFQGRDVTAASPQELREIRRRIGMIFQQFNLVRRASVLTNVLAGRLGYLPPAWALANYFPPALARRAAANLDRVGIVQKVFTRDGLAFGGAATARGHRPSPDAGARIDPGRRAGGQPRPGDVPFRAAIHRGVEQEGRHHGVVQPALPQPGPSLRDADHRPPERATGLRRAAPRD